MRYLALLPFLGAYTAATNIVISDDDGWATAQIRQVFDVLSSAGHNVRVLSLQEVLSLIYAFAGGPFGPRPQPVGQELFVQDTRGSDRTMSIRHLSNWFPRVWREHHKSCGQLGSLGRGICLPPFQRA